MHMRSIFRLIAFFIFFSGLSRYAYAQSVSTGFSLDANGWVSHNGASFVPLGMYDVPTGTEDNGYPNALPSMTHLNTIANPFWVGDASTANTFFSTLAPYGLYGLVGIDNLSTSAVTSYVNAIKSSHQLLGYFQPDEPSTQGHTVAHLTTVYNAIKAVDPNHLVILTDYKPPEQAAKYKSAYDVFNYDYYPIAETNVEWMRNDFKNFVTTAAPKPVWGILQSIFKPSPQWMEPTNDEIRSMAYVFFATGGKGMLSFEYCGSSGSSECIYGFPPDRPNMWNSIKAIFNEFESLSNILVSPTVPTITASTQTSGIDMLMKNYSGKHYLFAVNYRSSSNASGGHYPGVNLGNVTISLSGITSGTAKIVKGNGVGTTLTISNGSFVDSFPGYATKVYEISGNTSTPTPTPTPTPPTNAGTAISGVTGRLAWGAYVGSSTSDVTTFESLVGHKMDMLKLFVGGGDSFPSEFGSTVRDQGKTFVIFWEPYDMTLNGIISGSQDSVIKQFAAGAKAYGGPVLFAPLHEMNGDWNPWGGVVGSNSPAKVVTAWKHIHDLFAGISNVKFLWAVNGDSVPDTAENTISLYWPGSDYVDYIGLQNFNGPTFSTSESFDALFSSPIAQVKEYNKPIIISSTGCTQNAKKPAWITDALSVAIKKYPSVIGWIWFNENGAADWRVNSNEASLAAFKTMIPL